MNDAEIIKKLAQHDEQALFGLQQRYEAYCYHIAFSLLREEEAAEECVSDVWLAIWSVKELPNELKAYLAKVTRNAALQYLRKSSAKKRSATLVLLDELAECIPDPLKEGEFEAQMLRELLNAFVQSLKRDERYVFLKRYWYGYSASEIAEALGWRETKIRSMLFRLRKKLKMLLQEEGFSL